MKKITLVWVFMLAGLLVLVRCGKEGSGVYSYDIEILPKTVTVRMGATQNFQGKETTIKMGTSTISYESSLFTWTIVEGRRAGALQPVVGSSTTYRFTPAAVGEYHIQITSKSDPGTTAQATVKVDP